MLMYQFPNGEGKQYSMNKVILIGRMYQFPNGEGKQYL